jgi:hypothetical protein
VDLVEQQGVAFTAASSEVEVNDPDDEAGYGQAEEQRIVVETERRGAVKRPQEYVRRESRERAGERAEKD